MLALLYHARSRASVGCGGSLTGVSAARQHLVIAARRGDQASFERAALEHGRVLSWSCCRVATQPCWRRFYLIQSVESSSGTSLLEKERNRITWFWSHTKLAFLGEFVEGQGKSSLKGEGFHAREREGCTKEFREEVNALTGMVTFSAWSI